MESRWSFDRSREKISRLLSFSFLCSTAISNFFQIGNLLFLVCCKHIAQYHMQDPAVAIIIDLDSRIHTKDGVEGNLITLLIDCPYPHFTAGLQVIAKPFDM